ncbi:hypothetical protein G647_09655 [Cladophialophora carrionii CBS 160.54]|uniref:Tachykinin family protein n=1 Tax=Cladophialophora carrionii CBS 160.54 TaxID=1279043 RepID=V9DKT4_9EURO|nr:uncharacterized protein G647_09655 [Cladophialophora carrionii CBS 160.54]ETI27465.1 hypothetical protein G647_09655 [Cladophialophora carrionii CBS 160.54]
MQRVRQWESAQGRKRSTGREHPKGSAKSKARKKSADSETTVRNEAKVSCANDPLNLAESDRTTLIRSPRQSPRLNLSPGVHEFDPFDTLPTNTLPHQSSESLLQYCFDVMLPMTFSVEVKRTRDRIARQGLVLSSKISNPASFLGFLATTAAHRAVMYGRHRDLAPSNDNHDDLILDPDYARAKHEATVAVRQIFQQRAIVDEQMLEACFGLISTATVVGNFEEARLHLKILDRITSQIELSEQTSMWLPIANVKISVGLLERPVMPLPFKREPVPDATLRRISPGLPSQMARLGTSFMRLDQLSNPLRRLLSTQTVICHLCAAKAADSQSPSALETSILVKKSTEAEFDLLAYPYDADAFPRNARHEPELPALEGIVRLAALGMLSLAPHTIMPAAGNGRALTHHQKRAVEKWVLEQHLWHAEALHVMCWALLVFIQNSLKQTEEAFFKKLLAQVTHYLGLSDWEDVENVVYGYLYIHGLQSSTWKAVWLDVCRVRAQLYPRDEDRDVVEIAR